MKKRITAAVALVGPLLLGSIAPAEAAPPPGYEVLDHDQVDGDDHDHDGDGKPDHDPEDHDHDEDEKDNKKKPKE